MPGAKPLTPSERNVIYNDVMTQLMDMPIYERSKMCVWDVMSDDMKRFKVIMKLYRDTGREFNGSILIEELNRKLIYELYGDHRRKTRVYISKDYTKSTVAASGQEVETEQSD